MGKTKLIRKTTDGPDVPLPQVWSSLIALEENKADLARFLSEAIMQKGVDLPARCELVTEGGFSNATEALSMRRQTFRLQGNHEEADTRLILHPCEAVSESYERLLIKSSDTDVMLLILHFMPGKEA